MQMQFSLWHGSQDIIDVHRHTLAERCGRSPVRNELSPGRNAVVIGRSYIRLVSTHHRDIAARPEAGHPDRWRVLFVCCSGLFLLVSSLTSLNVALPELQADLGATTSDLQWIIDSYAVVFGGLLLTGGSIGDRIGRRPALTIGFALVALGGLAGGLADSVGTIIAARSITGLGGAMLLPATLSTLTDVFGDRERPRAIALWAGIAGAGGAFGPAIGGWLITVGSWNAVFWMNLVMAGIGIAATIIIVPKLPGVVSGPLDPIGAVLSTSAIGLILLAVIEAPSHPTSLIVIGPAVTGIVLVVLFIRHEGRSPAPMLPLSIFDSPVRCSGLITLLCAAVGFAGVIFVAALMLQIGWRESALATGLLLVPIGVAELATSFKTPGWCLTYGSGPVIATGLVVMACGYSAMALTPVGDRLVFVVAGVVAGIGNGLTIPPSVERVVGNTESDLAGVVAGANETAIELGASLGVAILGGIQRVVFENGLPPGVSSESVDAALKNADVETVLGAYLSGSRAALAAAAIAVLVAFPFAIRVRPPNDTEPSG
ncbi:MAG: MFS family permease [Ilumatobacter sp.]|jgi:MFS family permease